MRAKKDYLRDILHRVLGMELGRRATPAETHGFWSLLHGSASLIAAGEPPETEHVVAMFDRYFDFLRAAGAALP